ncbi:MAG: 5-fold beta-flower protein, partial [Bacteroidota bacterium]
SKSVTGMQSSCLFKFFLTSHYMTATDNTFDAILENQQGQELLFLKDNHILNKQGQILAYYEGNHLHNHIQQRIGKIEGNQIFNHLGQVLGHVEDEQLFNAQGQALMHLTGQLPENRVKIAAYFFYMA